VPVVTPELHRRDFLRLGAGGAVAVLVGSQAADAGSAVFLYGVASGDPTHTAVVIWTRVTPSADATPGSGRGDDTAVRWELAADSGFQRILRGGTASASAEHDHTVHVDVTGLHPGTEYWYRFRALGQTSPVGRTRTMPDPVGTPSQVKLGVVTCAELEWGYFTAYRHLACRDDITAVLYLGDYLYEYPAGRYDAGTTPGPSIGRTVQPAHEPITLNDYRQRWASYRLDPDLQTVHARHPAIAVWDDHETCNDAWRGGGQNHSEEDEGPWTDRFLHSRQAFFEWLPVRRPAPETEPLRLYRSLRIGTLAELWMLDERSYRDEHAQAAFLTFGSVDPAVDDPNRTLLGHAQRDWFLDGMAASDATWKVVGNPVVFAPYRLLADSQPLLDTLRDAGASVPIHHPVVATDAWTGYAAEQRLVVETLADRGLRNVVFLTGDAHASYANEVPLDPQTYVPGGPAVAVEFVAPGVTSPGLTKVIESQGLAGATRLEPLFELNNTLGNPWIRYYDGTVNGYGVLDLTPERAAYEFWQFDDPMDPAQQPALAAIYAVRSDSTTLSPLPVGTGLSRGCTLAEAPSPTSTTTAPPPTDDGILPATGGPSGTATAALFGTAGVAAIALRRRALEP